MMENGAELNKIEETEGIRPPLIDPRSKGERLAATISAFLFFLWGVVSYVAVFYVLLNQD